MSKYLYENLYTEVTNLVVGQVEMCDRVVLIRLGDIVADAPLSKLVASEGGLEAQFKALTA